MSKRAAAIIIAGFFTVFVAFAIRYSYGLLLPQMLPSLSISKAQAGVIFASYFMAYAVFSPMIGLLADRYDARFLLTLFVAMLGTGALLMSCATSVINASLFFTVAGIGHSACWVPFVTLIQRWVSEKRRGIALAFVDLGSATGIAAWSMVMPLIVTTYTWRAGWASLGLFAFLVSVNNCLIVRSHPVDQSSPRGTKAVRYRSEPIRATYTRLLTDNKFWLIGLSYLLMGFTVLIPFTFLTTYATQELTMPYEAATRPIAVIAVSGVIGKLALSHLSDSLGRIKVMMLCSMLTAAGSLGMSYVTGFLALNLCAAVFGLGYGAIWPLYGAAASDYFSKKSAGSVIGLWTLYLGIGSMISPIIGGRVIDATGAYGWAFILAVISAVMSLVLLLPIAQTPSTSAS